MAMVMSKTRRTARTPALPETPRALSELPAATLSAFCCEACSWLLSAGVAPVKSMHTLQGLQHSTRVARMYRDAIYMLLVDADAQAMRVL